MPVGTDARTRLGPAPGTTLVALVALVLAAGACGGDESAVRPRIEPQAKPRAASGEELAAAQVVSDYQAAVRRRDEKAACALTAQSVKAKLRGRRCEDVVRGLFKRSRRNLVKLSRADRPDAGDADLRGPRGTVSLSKHADVLVVREGNRWLISGFEQ